MQVLGGCATSEGVQILGSEEALLGAAGLCTVRKGRMLDGVFPVRRVCKVRDVSSLCLIY